MRYAIVTDTHAGVRNDAKAFADYQDRFWINTFFPTCKKNGIKKIKHLGDFFDKRQHLTIKTMENVKNTFCRLLDEYDMTMDLIVGNHDVLYRNTNEANSVGNFFHGYPRVNVITTPVKIGNILMVPWINRENYDDSIAAIESTDADYCAGHFEISGFEMHRGQVATSGLDSSIFSKFKLTMSGHFHTRSRVGDITYLGNNCEFTWADVNDPRGFHIFDDETGELEHFVNPESMFFRVEYDKCTSETMWIPYDPVEYKDTFIKVIATGEGSSYDLEQWRKDVVEHGPSELQIIESSVMTEGINIAEYEDHAAKSNIELIYEYVNGLTAADYVKESVMKYMNSLYVEAEAK